MSALRVEAVEELESLEDFRQRARSFIRGNLRQVTLEEMRWERNGNDDEAELATVTRDRELQRMLFEAGLAGICFPHAYGGQGLPHEYQIVLNEEIAGYEYPLRVQIPTLSPCAAVILEFGTEEQKLRHLPAILKGEELWMQFLSEPSGGSDVAGALTTAVRDGDQWVLNGSKVWTSGAWWSDWGLCLARTNWDLPKHRGLTVFMLPIHQPNVEVHRIEMNNGSREFCQEFMTDVIVPDTDRVGAVDEGWTVGTRWMFHERMLYNSSYVTEPVGLAHGSSDAKIVYDIARAHDQLQDPSTRENIGEARMLELVCNQLAERVGDGIRSGHLSDQAAGLVRLFKGTSASRIVTLAFDTAGSDGAAWVEGDTASMTAINFLMRQAGSLGGGTTEMARNVISERVLGMPRERRLDKDVPFRDVPPQPLDDIVRTSRTTAAEDEELIVPIAEINGMSLAYEVIGESGRPWVITPGGRFTKESPGVRQLAEALAEHDNKVLIWDRPNCGASDVCFEGLSESAMQADALAGLLTHLDMTPAVVAGGSGGSRVSLLAAARHPGTAAGLAIWWISGGIYGLLSLATHYCGGSVHAAWTQGMEAVADLPEWAEVQDLNPSNRDRILAQDRDAFVATMERWMLAYCPRADEPVPGLPATDAEALRIPALIFRSGASDPHHTRATSEALAAILPGARLVEPPWGDREWIERGEATQQGLFARWPLLAPQLLAWKAEVLG